jgi:KaiC/GvpD/RAD55 family RecA-like ATPase
MAKKVDAILSPNFVEEMLRLAFANKQFAELVVDNLDLSNFPRELGGCKAMLKVLADTMKKTGNLATFGMVEMTFPNNEEVSKKIAEVKGIKLPEVEPMTRQLETFIRRQTFVATQHEVSDMYNEGKPEEAMLLLEKRMAEINAFSLDKFRGKFVRVYRDFYRNIGTAQMKAEDETRRAKIPTGISTIDEITDGGIPRQDTVLLIMRSGVGKSTALKYFSWYNTSIAHNHCLHFQLEGGRDEAVVKFDQMLANTTYAKIMRGDVSDETRQRISALIKRAQTVNSDIDVYASEEMMDMTIADLVAAIEDYKKEYGYYPDLVTVDSIDLLLTGENKKIDFDPNFIKYRLQKCAQRLKDIAKKYDCAVITATQTGDVPIEVWNDPTRVITRQNTEGDRTLIKPFSFVFTGNIAIEEGKQNMARIYCDKLRNYRNNGIIIRIPTNYENGFFYDISRSTIVEQVLDMSALDRLESRRSRKGNGEAAVGEKKERVEIAPGVYGTKVVVEGETAAQEPQETLNKRQTKQSLKEYLANKGVQETPKTTRKPVPRKK